jgi:hypothetical protein
MTYDKAFTVTQSPLGTWRSYNLKGDPLITSSTEGSCVSATRFFLKGLQDGGFTPAAKTYDGTVGGKL